MHIGCKFYGSLAFAWFKALASCQQGCLERATPLAAAKQTLKNRVFLFCSCQFACVPLLVLRKTRRNIHFFSDIALLFLLVLWVPRSILYISLSLWNSTCAFTCALEIRVQSTWNLYLRYGIWSLQVQNGCLFHVINWLGIAKEKTMQNYMFFG